MKLLKSLLVFASLSASVVVTSTFAADGKTERQGSLAKETCVVEGVENIRTPRFKDTPQTQEIMAMERLLCQQIAEHAFDSVGEGLHEHGIILLEGGDILYGRDQQVAMFKAFIGEQGAYLTYEPAEAHVSQDGTMAWAIGLVKLTLPGEATEVQKYASVWEKVDGKWLNVLEMRNKNH
ncbi:nuclear transport factor 2 family protein [Vibrio sp. WXL103]|uniref:nuclear transport factor 2 family protein n=1 Tax=unclassified Vibrio TaxID=2614977 RepID=UPI003EC634DB